MWTTIRNRWKTNMPKFFKVMMKVFECIGGAVVAIHIGLGQIGITPHDWWTNAEPLILGISIGGCFVCKFTSDYKNGKTDNNTHNIETAEGEKTVLDKDDF